MTIFREEVGAWFLVMFVGLLTGKVWGWIGDGRVEILEQQPPANPRLFHIRLSLSLTMSIIYDLWLMNYTINTVIQQARPNMMVMFLFEFAILTTCSFATGFRYCISLIEARVQKKQIQERLVERRREVREERAEILRQREAAAAAAAEGGEGSDAAQSTAPLPSEDDVDEMDIEAPGWEAKGQWVLTLDLISGQSFTLHIWCSRLTDNRFHQTRHIRHVLCDSIHVLWSTNTHCPRSLLNGSIVYKTSCSFPQISSGNTRHEPEIRRRYTGRYSKRRYLYHLPRGDDALVSH
jgi:hypothetical protein